MSEPVMMQCGHVAQGINLKTKKPVCVICAGIDPGAEIPMDIVDEPDLTDRWAKCDDCGQVRKSTFELPFFNYKGPGSPWATKMCKCGIIEKAHDGRRLWTRCTEFKARGPAQYDNYYCGCRGWD